LAQEEQIDELSGLLRVVGQVELFVLRPGKEDHRRQRRLVGKEQDERARLAQVHQELPLHDRIFDQVHGPAILAEIRRTG
jgi:hypothetical protein